MKRSYSILVLILAVYLMSTDLAVAQVKIDSFFAFQTESVKRYSLYIPSTYIESAPNQLVLALHPLHQVWGNSTTWRDILTDFAEVNNLILAAPDGGADGRIDDPIDKAFMTALLDSVENWYKSIQTKNSFWDFLGAPVLLTPMAWKITTDSRDFSRSEPLLMVPEGLENLDWRMP